MGDLGHMESGAGMGPNYLYSYRSIHEHTIYKISEKHRLSLVVNTWGLL